MTINNKILRTTCSAPKIVGEALLIPHDCFVVSINNNKAIIRGGSINYVAQMDNAGLLSLI